MNYELEKKSDYYNKYLGLGDQFYFEFSCEKFQFLHFSETFFEITGHNFKNPTNRKGFFISSKSFQNHELHLIKDILEAFLQKEYDNINHFKVFFTYPLLFADGSEQECLAKVEMELFENKKIKNIKFYNTIFKDGLDVALRKGISFIDLKTANSYYNIISIDEFIQCNAIYSLSKREIEILHLVSNGLSNTETAELLNVSMHTITTHKKNIIKKTQTNSIMTTIKLCLRMNLF
ncbi:helix-turn-helix transcriptional regulator [Flammeovirga pacifica]|uniref:HTH luxR-type domain-containing protein n=1 Tax=Flammeovirga pacifica TaxID=915059 RepID=A0A1S1Z4I4_FLAPC|nr:helix-turn-helix transcriptional regulator [Flammeovirga pacifica]OHX68199.1 hypothetical protein NH26_18520 [Flammeovirga pacifica]